LYGVNDDRHRLSGSDIHCNGSDIGFAGKEQALMLGIEA
jgi:hypothetical protein